jgi:hypothetical protein
MGVVFLMWMSFHTHGSLKPRLTFEELKRLGNLDPESEFGSIASGRVARCRTEVTLGILHFLSPPTRCRWGGVRDGDER